LEAISSKSTRSAADVAETDPVVVWFGRDKKLATTFFKLAKYNSCTLNSEMNTSDLSKVEKLDLSKNGGNV
jgi:hypothetical protein